VLFNVAALLAPAFLPAAAAAFSQLGNPWHAAVAEHEKQPATP
jgi:hypothetical protein